MVFTQDDLDRLAAAMDYIREFEEKVMVRFKLYAATVLGFDVDERVAQSGGFLSFRPRISKSLTKGDIVEIIETMASDHGLSSTRVRTMPVSSLFATSSEEQDMAEFLRLKAKLGK